MMSVDSQACIRGVAVSVGEHYWETQPIVLLGNRRPGGGMVSVHFDVSPPMSRVSSGSRLAARMFSR